MTDRQSRAASFKSMKLLPLLPLAPARKVDTGPKNTPPLPPSSSEPELSLSLNHDQPLSLPRCMFAFVRGTFWASSCHDTVQRRIQVVASHATGTPMPRTLLQRFEFGYMKYAMFAGVPGSFSAALCFHFGSRPRRALRLWQTLLPPCRTRSVWCIYNRGCISVHDRKSLYG